MKSMSSLVIIVLCSSFFMQNSLSAADFADFNQKAYKKITGLNLVNKIPVDESEDLRLNVISEKLMWQLADNNSFVVFYMGLNSQDPKKDKFVFTAWQPSLHAIINSFHYVDRVIKPLYRVTIVSKDQVQSEMIGYISKDVAYHLMAPGEILVIEWGESIF